MDASKGESYGVPADNPFVGRTDAKPEIWAYGFRNPWRCCFDMGGSKQLFCADVQQNSVEEVDIVTKGGNYGWRVKEASKCFDFVNPNTHPASCESAGMIDPIIEYPNCNVTQDCKGLSITGGFVYRGSHQPLAGQVLLRGLEQAVRREGRPHLRRHRVRRQVDDGGREGRRHADASTPTCSPSARTRTARCTS